MGSHCGRIQKLRQSIILSFTFTAQNKFKLNMCFILSHRQEAYIFSYVCSAVAYIYVFYEVILRYLFYSYIDVLKMI